MPSSPRHKSASLRAPGRPGTQLSTKLRSEILAGKIAAGEFLPTERKLSASHGLAVMTVRRALQQLQREGLVTIEPRRGCRVLAAANDPLKGCPLAHLHAYSAETVLDGVQSHINLALQGAAARRGWSALAVHVGPRPPAEVLEQLRAARAWGIILETAERGLLDLVRDSGVPAIMVNAWTEGAPFDAVLQDNYQGGFLAAQHLIERGHRKIAWFGPVGASNFSRERLGGASAALAAAGLDLPAELRTDTALLRSGATEGSVALAKEPAGRDLEEAATELLSRRDRPKAVLTLWTDVALALAAAARKLGLVLGRDLDMVGWALEAHLDKYRPTFAGGPVPPMITWRVEDLARAAVARLAERRADPGMPAMRIAVATRLRMGEET